MILYKRRIFKNEIDLSYLQINRYYCLYSPLLKLIPCSYQLTKKSYTVFESSRIHYILRVTVQNNYTLESSHIHYIIRHTVYNYIKFFLSVDGSCYSCFLTYEKCVMKIFSMLLFSSYQLSAVIYLSCVCGTSHSSPASMLFYVAPQRSPAYNGQRVNSSSKFLSAMPHYIIVYFYCV